jgi:hypothetical protein
MKYLEMGEHKRRPNAKAKSRDSGFLASNSQNQRRVVRSGPSDCDDAIARNGANTRGAVYKVAERKH